MDWILTQTQHILSIVAWLLIAPIMKIGDKHFSIGSIVFLVLLAIAIFFISRWISDWLKYRILHRFERGLREAIATILSYLLAGFGLLILLQTAGIDLSSLTVLAGVLGIGVGFGLQNLASNFISGLTLLFEQPIKVGDFIEVDGLLGTVEKISIRSTIVRTNDDVFVIVPNLRFVEQNIINWSYRAPRCRIHIPVAVAYGSDSVVVTEALMEAARLQPMVLSNPTPKVWFHKFGESSLNFELLVWIDRPEESEPIKSSLNFLIEHELRHRHIEIPFPQRDLRLRNMEELAALFRNGAIAQPLHARASDESNGKTRSQTSDAATNPSHPSQFVGNLSLRDLLRRVAYFEQCTDLELRQLIEYGYRQLFPSDYIVCREHDPGDSFYIILTGCVEVFSQRAGKYIATLHAGEFFGEMSLLLGTPRSATVRTLEETTLFIVDRNDLQKLLVDHLGLADQIAQKLAERQQALRDMGLATEGLPSEPPLIWMRKQIQTLFGI
jgi:small-conductance mechanosensitive channel